MDSSLPSMRKCPLKLHRELGASITDADAATTLQLRVSVFGWGCRLAVWVVLSLVCLVIGCRGFFEERRREAQRESLDLVANDLGTRSSRRRRRRWRWSGDSSSGGGGGSDLLVLGATVVVVILCKSLRKDLLPPPRSSTSQSAERPVIQLVTQMLRLPYPLRPRSRKLHSLPPPPPRPLPASSNAAGWASARDNGAACVYDTRHLDKVDLR